MPDEPHATRPENHPYVRAASRVAGVVVINDTRRWRDMGSKLWITDSDVYESGSGESCSILGRIVNNDVLSNRSKLRLSQAERYLLDTYGPRDGDYKEHGDGGSVVLVNIDSEKSCIDFENGEYPHLPRQCEHFLFSSFKVNGNLLAQPSIQGAKQIHDVSMTSICEIARARLMEG